MNIDEKLLVSNIKPSNICINNLMILIPNLLQWNCISIGNSIVYNKMYLAHEDFSPINFVPSSEMEGY